MPFYGGNGVARTGKVGVFVRIQAVFVLFLAILAVNLGVSAFAASKHKPSRPASIATPQPVPAKTVAYEPDGTPVATGEPRRLSPLAGKTHSLALNRSQARKPVRPPQVR